MKQQGILTFKKKEELIKSAIKKILSKKKVDKLKANIDGFEPPAHLTKASGEGSYVPDIIAIKNGGKSYYELAIKNKKVQETVSKWKLLDQLANLRNGKFYLIVPRGNYAFVQRIMDRYSLRANIIKL